MDKERKDGHSFDVESWLDEVLGKLPIAEELGPDETAVSSAKLTHPKDAELEKILSEDWASVPDEAELEAHAEDLTQRFVPPVEDLPEETSAEEPEPAPVQKGRPKRKKGVGLLGIPHLLSTVIWLALILAVGVSLGRLIWVCCADIMAFGKESQKVTITITDADDIDSVSQKLGKAKLVRYPELFKFFAQITGKDENISSGTFTLNSHFDYNAMINAMTSYASAREEVDIMFPEGYNCAQVFQLLEEKGVCTVKELEDWAATGELSDYWFLEGVSRGNRYCLEGYLFPDTYTFYTNDEPRRVLEKFLDGFDYRFTDLMKERLEEINVSFAEKLRSEGYDQSYIDSHQITIREIVIIASLIEKETAGADESYTISSVIYNRLSDSSNPHFLNIDAALVYALDGNIDPETGKSKPLTESDKLLNSPYNTYMYAGLIPGPIANPGRDCLNAALVPEDTDYYYYAYNPDTGRHHFTRTYDEHLAFLAKLG